VAKTQLRFLFLPHNEAGPSSGLESGPASAAPLVGLSVGPDSPRTLLAEQQRGASRANVDCHAFLEESLIALVAMPVYWTPLVPNELKASASEDLV